MPRGSHCINYCTRLNNHKLSIRYNAIRDSVNSLTWSMRAGLSCRTAWLRCLWREVKPEIQVGNPKMSKPLVSGHVHTRSSFHPTSIIVCLLFTSHPNNLTFGIFTYYNLLSNFSTTYRPLKKNAPPKTHRHNNHPRGPDSLWRRTPAPANHHRPSKTSSRHQQPIGRTRLFEGFYWQELWSEWWVEAAAGR